MASGSEEALIYEVQGKVCFASFSLDREMTGHPQLSIATTIALEK